MDRTNETASGYTYNGQNYTNQTKVDSQGNNYTVSVPTAISASSLATPSAPIAVTQPNYNTSGMSNQAAQAGAYINNGALTAQQQAEQIAKQNEINLTNEKNYLNTTLGSLQSSVGGKGADLLNAYNQQDASGNSVNSLAAKLRGYSAQSQALGLDNLAKTQQEINNATGQNITQSAVNRNTADATRNNLIQQASIAMQSAIVSADYESAKSYADQMINAKYDQKLADIEAAKTNIANIQDQLTSAEKKTAQATLERLNQEKIDQQNKIDTEKGISEIGLTLRKYGVSDSVVNDVLKNSSSVNDALIRAGNNLQDPKAQLELQSIRADIAYKQAQTAKTNREAQLSQEPTPKEKKEAEQAITQAKASVQAAHDKIDAVDAALGYKDGIASRVGTNMFGRGIVAPLVGGAVAGAGLGPFGAVAGAGLAARSGITSAITGEGQQLSGAVHQLTSGLTLQTLIDAKANGATFGALSDGERSMIASAATKLNDWEIKDSKGNPTGYWNIDETSFKKELKTIQDLSRRALLKSQGTLISPDEQKILDSAYGEQTAPASAYY